MSESRGAASVTLDIRMLAEHLVEVLVADGQASSPAVDDALEIAKLVGLAERHLRAALALSYPAPSRDHTKAALTILRGGSSS